MESWKSPKLWNVSPPVGSRLYRLGAPNTLSAKPLVLPLLPSPRVSLLRTDCAGAVESLFAGKSEAALVDVMQLQHCYQPLMVLPAGCVASAGGTLAVRLFSKVPPELLTTIWAPEDRPSLIALAEILWCINYRRQLNIVPFDPSIQEAPEEAEGVLLHGDAVVLDPPLGFDWQFDLCAIWHELTGLPFVLAVWAMTPESPGDCEALYRLLLSARIQGQHLLRQIAERHSRETEYPEDLALRLLTRQLEFAFTDSHRDAIEEFFCLAAEYSLVDSAEPISYYGPGH